jgi:hypothetical protein
MESLETAVVDVSRLIASSRAVRSVDISSIRGKARTHQRRLRAELESATTAYLKALSRAPEGVFDGAALRACRLAAEQSMPTAIASVDELLALMDQGAGSLDGWAASRHDLWRLSHIAIHLREGAARLRDLESKADDRDAKKAAKSLQKELRRALVAYAHAAMRIRGALQRSIRDARKAATERMSSRCVDVADLLSWLEGELSPATTRIRDGVAQPLRDLLVDWAAAAA